MTSRSLFYEKRKFHLYCAQLFNFHGSMTLMVLYMASGLRFETPRKPGTSCSVIRLAGSLLLPEFVRGGWN